MDWVKGNGATHATPEDCESAAATLPPLRGPQPEDPEARKLIVERLLSHRWQPATSPRYRTLPHEYTVKVRHWRGDEDAFRWCVEHIRAHGYEERFIGRTWLYYAIGDLIYWDCGGPVSDVGLINRAVRRTSAGLLPLEPQP